MHRLFLIIVTAALLAAPVSAECPCVPVTHVWTVKTCPDWSCASVELLLANGDPQVIAIPAGMGGGRWLIVRRLASGTAAQDENDPFQLRQYDSMTTAVDRYTGISGDLRPQLMTAPDGQFLVIALKEREQATGRRRSAPH